MSSLDSRIIDVFNKWSGNKDLITRKFSNNDDMVSYLNMDSLDTAELCLSLEDEFGVCFEGFVQSDQKFTINNILHYILTCEDKI